VPRLLAGSGVDWRLSAILAAARRFVLFWASGEKSFPKMGDFFAQDADEPPCKI